MWGKLAACGRMVSGPPMAECYSATVCHPASMALRANRNEYPQRPDTIRPQDAILPHMKGALR
jgi:hypothetical protein